MSATQSHAVQSVDADVVDDSIGVLWVPDWPIIAAISEGELPGHLPSVLCRNSRVQAVSAQARRLGIRVGMSKRTAQSLVPDLVAGQDSPVQRVRAFEPVMNAVEEVVANAVVLRPGLVMFGAKGAVNFHGGQNQLGERLLGAAAYAGVEAHVGVAVGILPAILAARNSAFIPPQRTRAFLYPHPVGAIMHAATTPGAWRDYREVISAWEKLGLTRVGDVAQLDGGVVAARFGRVGVEAHRLAQGLGWVDSSDEQAGEHVQVGSDIDPPAQRVDTAAFIVRNLAQQLHDALIRRGLACHSLRVVALTEAGEPHDRLWRLEGAPKVGEVTDRVRWQLSGWLEGRGGQSPTAGLSRIDLIAEDTYPAGARQTGLWGSETRGSAQAKRAAERVQSLVGAEGVVTAVAQGGRGPSERIRYVAWGDEPQPQQQVLKEWVGQLPQPLPTTIFTPGRKVEIMGGGHPVRMTTKGGLNAPPEWINYDGQTYPVDGWAGPWPIHGRWWEGEVPRVYLQIVTVAGAWLVSGGKQDWFIEGVYD